ncbi:hypothetical protein JNB88_27575 [Rhizobium cauense]|uniref:ribosome modulation factor n=1 Tax=Rhizobium cauense TaxID=1166683 RepID=UPI001C6F0660|nr:hypothetical protein [Rhizobium cauense]MBW9117385.1 hypothetical protein [Rhizobium cauense]
MSQNFSIPTMRSETKYQSGANRKKSRIVSSCLAKDRVRGCIPYSRPATSSQNVEAKGGDPTTSISADKEVRTFASQMTQPDKRHKFKLFVERSGLLLPRSRAVQKAFRLEPLAAERQTRLAGQRSRLGIRALRCRSTKRAMTVLGAVVAGERLRRIFVKKELQRAFEEGRQAYRDGKPIDANPNLPAHSLRYTAWEDGWQAQRKAEQK